MPSKRNLAKRISQIAKAIEPALRRKREATDSTIRNVQSANKRLDALQRRLKAVEDKVARLQSTTKPRRTK